MSLIRIVGVVLAAAAVVPATAFPSSALEGVSISIEKHAQPTAAGGVVVRVHVTCGPLPGSPDYTEGFAGAFQPKSGAEAEGGLSPDLVCDGIERTYTAGVSLISDASFKRGSAEASASLFACSVLDDQQVCIDGSASGRIIVSGREVP